MSKTKKAQKHIQKLLHALSGSWFQWRDRYYLTKEQALVLLKDYTGQDFGYDVEAWRRWFDENPDFEFKN